MNFERIHLEKDGVSVSWDYTGDYVALLNRSTGKSRTKPCMRLNIKYQNENISIPTSFSAKQSFNDRYVALMYVLLYVIDAIKDGVESSSIANQLSFINENNYKMYEPNKIAI